MQVKEIDLYPFEELSEPAKEKARDWWRQFYPDYDWWDGVYEMAKEAGECLGIDVDRIFFTGFWDQGDGACIEGSYCYRKGWREELKKKFSGDLLRELEEIGDLLQTVQAPAFYKLSANVRQNGLYMHSGCTDIQVEHEDRYATRDEEEGIKEGLRDFMDWIYRKLENEYEWLMSDEQVDEAIINNGHMFSEDGSFKW